MNILNILNILDILSPARVGGVLLILGSYFVMKGNVFNSVAIFFVADCMWCILAYRSNDTIGLVCTILGMLLGVVAYIKMNRGNMRKTLEL